MENPSTSEPITLNQIATTYASAATSQALAATGRCASCTSPGINLDKPLSTMDDLRMATGQGLSTTRPAASQAYGGSQTALGPADEPRSTKPC